MKTTPKRVLIIDDDPDTLKFLKDTLEDNAFSVETALTALEGLEKARALHPDMILLDLMLPQMSGFGFMREMHHWHLEDTPVVVLSALNDEEISKESLDLGAVSFLSKSCNPKILVSVLREYSP